MTNVYLALKKSVVFVLLFLAQAAFAQPVINSFYPGAGPAGTVVYISGTGFNLSADSNFVYFGAAKATVLASTSDSLLVVVPKGATYAPITVTTNSLTAYSRLSFNVTFTYGSPVLDTTSFAPVYNCNGTNNPRAVTLADLNADGLSDLFVTSQAANSAAVYTNTSVNGSVSFSAAQNISLGAGPFGAAIGDLNGDGKLDVAVANSNAGSAGTVTVLRNTTVGSTISFASNSYATGSGTLSVAIADLDKDGRPDLLVTSGNSGYISIFRNTTTTTGAITFAPKVTISDVFHSDNITVADFDGDGLVDFATANFAAGISIWKNYSTPGSISFPSHIDYTAGVNPAAVAVGDLNRDGKPDLVVRNYSSSTFSVFKNLSSSGNIQFASKTDFAIGTNSGGLAIGDLNGDGQPDVVVSSGISGSVSLYTNISGSDTITFTAPANYATGYGPTGIAIGDVNGDGRYDIAVGNNYSRVTIFKNNQILPPVPVITSFSPTSGKKGTPITIFGKGFNGTTAVRFGGVRADSVVVWSDTVIRAIVDTGATGSVLVTTPYGTASKAGFTFIRDTIPTPDTARPVVINFWPTSGSKGTPVYILGAHFSNATGTYFGGVRADSIVILSDTMIRAVVGNGSTGGVTVVNPYGFGTKPGFTFIPDTTNLPDSILPSIISFNPTSGTNGTIVTIFGRNFTSNSFVRFGNVYSDSVLVLSDSVIKARVDTGATGYVTVFTAYGTANKPGFTYISDTTINDTLFVNAHTVGVNGVTQQSFKLYPNPASKYVTWQQPVINHKTRLQLVDMVGRVVKQVEVGANTAQTTVPLHGLHTGVYKLVYIDGKSKITNTLLIK